MRRIATATLLLLAAIASPQFAAADEVADFYRGKQVKLIIGYAPGTGYDVHARLLGRHLGRHIPGEPTIVPQTMEGAGSLRAGLYVFNVAERDGLTIGAMNRSMVLAPLLGTLDASQGNFDPRQLGWVGSINTATTVGWSGARAASPSSTTCARKKSSSPPTNHDERLSCLRAADEQSPRHQAQGHHRIFRHDRELPGDGAGRDDRLHGHFLFVAQSHQAGLDSRQEGQHFDSGRSKPGHLNCPYVPMITSLATSPAEKQALELLLAPQEMSRPYFTTPGVPPARLAALQKALMDTMKDPGFIADAQKMGIDIDPMNGQDIHALLDRIYKTPPEAIEAAKRATAVKK